MIALTILFLGTVATLAIAFMALRKGFSSQTSQLFALMSIAMSGWSITTYLSLLPSDSQLQLIRLSMFFVVLMNSAFFYLLAVFPKRQKAWAKTYYGYLVLAIIALGATMSPWMFTGLEISGSNVSPIVGPGMAVFLLHAVVFVGSSLWLLINKLKRSRGLERLQLRYVALGLAAFIILTPLTNFILPVVFKQSALVNLSPINSVLFALAIGYAIVQHRLMDIRLVVVHSATYILTVSILVTIYTFAMFGLGSVVAIETVSTTQTVLYAVLAIFVALSFQPLRSTLDGWLRRLFYKSHYDEAELIANVTSIMAETLDLSRLTNYSLDQIVNTIQVAKGGFWVSSEEGFDCVASHEMDREEQRRVTDELLKDICNDKDCAVALRADGSKELRKIGMEVAVPLFAGDELQGVLLLGEKKSGDIYTDQDINALQILGSSLAISLENARSYKQISEFNQTLAEEVDKATRKLTVANDKLQRSNIKLRQLDSLKDEFISITSHELRTPLTAIRGYLWMAMHGKAGNAKTEAEYMERAYTSTERLIALVNDSLDISRIDSGRVQLNPLPTDIYSLAQEVIADLLPRAQQQEQQLRVRRPSKALPAVVVDPEKLYQVLTNLVGNALKFTPSQGRIVVSFAIDEDKVVTTVSDTGPGISDEDKKRLFQKFSRLDASATIPGTGLGLFLCREIIHLSKGRIWVESKLGHGSSFKFTLPTTPAKAIKAEDRGQHPQRIVVA